MVHTDSLPRQLSWSSIKACHDNDWALVHTNSLPRQLSWPGLGPATTDWIRCPGNWVHPVSDLQRQRLSITGTHQFVAPGIELAQFQTTKTCQLGKHRLPPFSWCSGTPILLPCQVVAAHRYRDSTHRVVATFVDSIRCSYSGEEFFFPFRFTVFVTNTIEGSPSGVFGSNGYHGESTWPDVSELGLLRSHWIIGPSFVDRKSLTTVSNSGGGGGWQRW